MAISDTMHGIVARCGGVTLTASQQLARTVAMHDAMSVCAALLAAIDMYVDLRSDEVPREMVRGMPDALFSYLDEASIS